jgi:alkylhydroperoxidase family enzyme
MLRIAPAQPPYPETIQATLAKLLPPGMEPIVLFTVLARDERLFARSVGAGLLDRGHVSLHDRELVILRVCANNGSEYEWGVHVATFSAKAGLDETQIRATLSAELDAGCWSERERLLLRLCDELQHGCSVSDALWSALAAQCSPETLLELLLLIGFYRTISMLTNTLRLPLEPFAARFPGAA